jgi:meso-butanediol dehydrogenase / (S,S)-butanediol dehydrogenase / diacetyl reductase
VTARLNGKVALISGTGSGMGRAAARLFAAEGAMVVGTDVNADANSETAELVRKDGNTMTSIAPLDVSEPAGAQAWIEAAVEQHGGIDILYNNAGNTRFGSFPGVSVEDYEYTIRNELGSHGTARRPHGRISSPAGVAQCSCADQSRVSTAPEIFCRRRMSRRRAR